MQAINAGTSPGVVLSGPIAVAMAGQWRLAFAAFAAVAVSLIARFGLDRVHWAFLALMTAWSCAPTVRIAGRAPAHG